MDNDWHSARHSYYMLVRLELRLNRIPVSVTSREGVLPVRIEFLPGGETKKARDNEKGHLLERLIARFLTSNGYTDVDLNEIVEGTEWDVTGKAALTGSPVIVSCKCLSKSVSPEPLQALAYNTINLSMTNPTASGVLIAIPRLSPAAEANFDSMHSEFRKRIKVYDEARLLETLIERQHIVNPAVIRYRTEQTYDLVPGDTRVLETARGTFVAQFVLTESHVQGYLLFTKDGQECTPEQLQQLRALFELNGSDLHELECLDYTQRQSSVGAQPFDERAHFTVQGMGWFDYKYPAPPECCVGRENEADSFMDYFSTVASEKTSSRVCVITGPSGIGKSSLLLKLGDGLAKRGGRLFSLNCISARGKSFLVAVFTRLLTLMRPEVPELSTVKITGLDSLAGVVREFASRMRDRGQFPVVMFDQFEIALLDGPLSEGLVELVLALEEMRAPIIVGFAWKTDLWWPDDHVPYTAREHLRQSAFSIRVDHFGPSETNRFLQALEKEIGSSLRPELSSAVREFSRGWPWLLKKVCWHILEQYRRGASQKDIIERQLDLRSLFEADLDQLDEEERDTLTKLSAVLPADGKTIQESFPEVQIAERLNKFVNSRLVIRQGDTYSIYHDIFKEFLRTGRVPIEESYLLKASPKKSLEIVRLLADAGGSLPIETLAAAAHVKVESLYNYLRDLVCIGLLRVLRGQVSMSMEGHRLETEDDLIRVTRIRLNRNTCVKLITDQAYRSEPMHLSDVVMILKREFPSVQAQAQTWNLYARILMRWLNYVRPPAAEPLTIQGVTSNARLVGSKSTAQYPQGFLAGVRRLTSLLSPTRQLSKREIADELKVAAKTAEKCLVDARLLGFCERMVDGRFRLTQLGRQFQDAGETGQSQILRDAISQIPYFAATLQLLRDGQSIRSSVREVLRGQGKTLRPSTITSLQNISSNWLTHAGIRGTEEDRSAGNA